MLCPGNNAAAGALIEASPEIQMILALIERFRGCMAQLSAACWVARVASDANPADAPSRDTPMFRTPDVERDLASLPMGLRPRRVLGDKVKQLSSSIPFVGCVWATPEHTRAATTLQSIAYRSSGAATAKHADMKAMGAGDEATQLKADEMLMDTVTEGQGQHTDAMPQESDASLRDALFIDASLGGNASLGDRSYDDSGGFG